ncbi:phage head morphogenesis protein, partial [bacterium]|nr:phage head morphogenesis protein [bacterium]
MAVMKANLYAWALAIQAAAKQPDYDCILVPSEIADMAAKKHGEAVKIGTAVSKGEFEKLTMKQLQKLAQANSISVARTKKDFIKLLKPLEPDVDLESLKGTQLKALIKKHKIGALRSKEELIALLKQQVEKEAKEELTQQLVQQQIEAVKEKIASGLSELPALKPQNFQQALTKLDEMSQALSDAKKLLPEAEWTALKGQVEFAGESFVQSVKALSAGELKQIAKAAKLKHYQWASKDELIVLMTSTDKGKIEAVKAGIEAKWAKWAEKHGGKKGKVKPKQPPSKITTPTPKPAMPNELTAADDAWQKFLESELFKFQGRADIEGTHTKYFFLDKRGDKWLFKPAEEFRGYGDDVAYRIGRLIDPDAIEVRYIELDVPERGRLKGSIQKWRTDLKKEFDFRDTVVEKLSAAELEQLQREHVIDWLISNHDAHGKQFLRLKNGHIRGLDKSQLFKYLGDDKLSITYHPNHGWGEKEPFYNAVMRAWRDGTIDLDLQATYRYIRRVETITDEAYTELLKPYAKRRFRGQPLKLKQFYETALARKNNIRNDFEEFYTRLLRQRTGDRKVVFHFDLDIKELPADKAARKWKHIPEEAEALIDDARESGWQGKSLPVDIDDIEDQNVLLYTEKVKGKIRTVIRMKIRPEAERKLLSTLATSADDTLGQAAGSALADDLFYDDILTAVKSINHHIKQGDFNFNNQKISQVLNHRTTLLKLSKSRDSDLKAMARAYLKMLDEIDASVAAGGRKKIGAFDRFLKQEPVVKPSGDKIPAVKRTMLYGDQKQVQKGQIRVVKEDIEFGKYHQNFTSRGLEYRIDLADGVEGIYRPWIKENYYAHQGQLELRLTAECTPETADRLLSKLERLGIEASFASPDEAEILYLMKSAYILKDDATPAWKKLLRNLDTGKASPAERVKALRQYWSDRIGIEDVTRIPGYNPEGRYSIMSSAWKKKREAGYRHQLRFDLTDEQIKRELKDYGLHHSLT